MKAAWSKKASLLIWLAIAWIVSASPPVQAQKLRVGVAGSAPFAIQVDILYDQAGAMVEDSE